MRVMVLVKATADSEKKFELNPISQKMMDDMGKFNDALKAAGIFVDAAGLTESARGKRVTFDGASRTVVDGPFAQPGELVAGFWIWDVKDMDEAVAWVKKCPNPMPCRSDIEIRPFMQLEDFQ